MQTPTPSTCSVLGHQLDPVAEKNCAAPDLYNWWEGYSLKSNNCHKLRDKRQKTRFSPPKRSRPQFPSHRVYPLRGQLLPPRSEAYGEDCQQITVFPQTTNNQTKAAAANLMLKPAATFSWLFLVCKHTETITGKLGPLGIETYGGFFYWIVSIPCSWFLYAMTLLLRHWYEIMALYYVKSIFTEMSASRQDRRVLQKSKIIRIKFLSIWGMLQTSGYV